MFCTNCGSRHPESAVYCNKCGHRLSNRPSAAARTANTVKRDERYGRVRKGGSLTTTGVIARVAAALTVVFMLMPWLEVPAIKSLGQLAGNFGINLPSDDAFPMYDMGSVTGFLDLISRSNVFGAIQKGFLVLWAIALLLIVVGFVRSFFGEKLMGLLKAGGIAAVVVAVAWFAAITYFDGAQSAELAQLIGGSSQLFAVPFAVWGTAIAGLTSAVCNRAR